MGIERNASPSKHPTPSSPTFETIKEGNAWGRPELLAKVGFIPTDTSEPTGFGMFKSLVKWKRTKGQQNMSEFQKKRKKKKRKKKEEKEESYWK